MRGGEINGPLCHISEPGKVEGQGEKVKEARESDKSPGQ